MSTHFIASVEDNAAKSIQSIVKALEAKGCKIENVLPFSGIITGSFKGDNLLDNFKLKGIKEIEYSKNIKAI